MHGEEASKHSSRFHLQHKLPVSCLIHEVRPLFPNGVLRRACSVPSFPSFWAQQEALNLVLDITDGLLSSCCITEMVAVLYPHLFKI